MPNVAFKGTRSLVKFMRVNCLCPHGLQIYDLVNCLYHPSEFGGILWREYFKQGKIEQFRQILEEGLGPGTHARLLCSIGISVACYVAACHVLCFVLFCGALFQPLLLISEIEEYYADVRYERIAILNALGAYYSYLGKIETKQREKEEHFIQATQFYNRASRINMHEPSTWVGKGSNL